MIWILAVIWYAFGVYSFIYWWTTEYDFTTEQLLVALMAGTLGPITWFIGSSIHSPDVPKAPKEHVTLVRSKASRLKDGDL